MNHPGSSYAVQPSHCLFRRTSHIARAHARVYCTAFAALCTDCMRRRGHAVIACATCRQRDAFARGNTKKLTERGSSSMTAPADDCGESPGSSPRRRTSARSGAPLSDVRGEVSDADAQGFDQDPVFCPPAAKVYDGRFAPGGPQAGGGACSSTSSKARRGARG